MSPFLTLFRRVVRLRGYDRQRVGKVERFRFRHLHAFFVGRRRDEQQVRDEDYGRVSSEAENAFVPEEHIYSVNTY